MVAGWSRGGVWLLLVATSLLAGALLPPNRGGASVVDLGPLDLELDGPGENVDDPCFWTSREPGARRALLFATAKDSGLVEVFDLPRGTLIGAIGGFGRPNNCVVAGDLLLTTDREPGGAALPGKVKVHHLPDLVPVRTFGEDLVEPHGIDVATIDGVTRVYVTDSSDATLHVYDLATGARLAVAPTGFGRGIEPVLVDALHGRIFIPRGEKEETRGVGIFDMEGKLLREFGADVVQKDAEGLAIYACGDGGYLIVTDQHKKKTEFEVFDRRELRHLRTFALYDGRGDYSSATDGIDILQTPMEGFPAGMLAVCDGCGTNQPDEVDVVSWARVARALGLKECPGGVERRQEPAREPPGAPADPR
jgi:3-phytase